MKKISASLNLTGSRVYRIKTEAMKALLCMLFTLAALSDAIAQTTVESEGGVSPAAYYDAYFELRRSFWEGPEKELDDGEVEQLQQVVRSLNKISPQSIKALHVRYVHSGFKTEFGRDLQKAIEQQPGDYDELLIPFLYVTEEVNLLRDALTNLSNKGVISNPTLDYHHTMVQWLPKGSVVVTNGKDDTYALLLAQLQHSRDDLFVLPLDYLSSEEFRNQIVAKLGNDPVADYFSGLGERPDRMEALDELTNVQSVGVHFAFTLPPNWLSANKNLYPEGFSLSNRSQFSENPQLLYTQAMASFDLEGIQYTAPIAVNYLPVLIAWFNASKILGHEEQAEKIADKVRLLAVKTADAKSVLKMLDD